MNPPRARILVVDDEPDERRLLGLVLSQAGYHVETAEDGRAAVASVEDRPFDVVVCDLMMPHLDGVETLAALKRLSPDTEVVIATAHATVETAIACMKQGAFDYVSKPFDVPELKAQLERAVARRQERRALAVYEATRALLASIRRGDLIALCLQLAGQVARAGGVALLLEREGGPACYHSPSAWLPDDAVAALALEAVATRGVRHVPPEQIPRTEPAIGAALVAPLATGERAIGALVLLRGAGLLFTATDAHHAQALAAQLALALDNERLYGEIEDKLTRR